MLSQTDAEGCDHLWLISAESYFVCGTIIDSHTGTPAEDQQKIHHSVHFLSLTIQLAVNFSRNAVNLLQ